MIEVLQEIDEKFPSLSRCQQTCYLHWFLHICHTWIRKVCVCVCVCVCVGGGGIDCISQPKFLQIPFSSSRFVKILFPVAVFNWQNPCPRCCKSHSQLEKKSPANPSSHCRNCAIITWRGGLGNG